MPLKRQPHTMKAPKPRLPKCLVFFDTETARKHEVIKKRTKSGGVVKGDIHRLAFGYYIYVKWNDEIKDYEMIERDFFYDEKSFLEKLVDIAVKEQKAVWVFAHRMAFDYTAIQANRLIEYGFHKTNETFVDSGRFIIKWRKKLREKNYATIIFIDSMNYFKVPLEQLGETFGIKKLKKEFKFNFEKRDILEYAKIFGWEVVKKYCKRDVEIIAIAITFLIKKVVLEYKSKFAYTIAGIAYNILKSMMPYKVKIHGNAFLDRYERAAYFGGRTEAFRIGMTLEEIKKLDVNSLYPSVMRENVYPTKFILFKKEPDEDFINRVRLMTKQKKIVYIADVTVQINEPKLPVKLNGKLVFPVGQIRGIWTSAEIELLSDKEILKWHSIAVYEAKPLFKTFVETFYALRKLAKQQKDKVNDIFHKLLLNSSYGKFGQMKRVEIRCPELDSKVIKYGITTIDGMTVRYMDGEAYIVTKERKPSFDSFIAIAAFVAAYARAKMWKFMKKAGLENVYYMDTDSLFVNLKGYINLTKEDAIDPYELGKLKNEGDFDGVIIYAAKDYQLLIREKLFGMYMVTEEKHKGIPKKARQINHNTFTFKKFLGFKETYKYFHNPYLIQVEIVKKVKRTYDKRVVYDTGVTEPFHITKLDDPMKDVKF